VINGDAMTFAYGLALDGPIGWSWSAPTSEERLRGRRFWL